MAGEKIPRDWLEAAWTADRAWVHSPDRERGGSWASVPESQLCRLLSAAAPLIAEAERQRIAGALPFKSFVIDRPYWMFGHHTALTVVAADDLYRFLAAEPGTVPAEAPMPDNSTGIITVLTASGEHRFPMTRFDEDDTDGLTVYDGDRKVARFLPGAWTAYYTGTPAAGPQPSAA